MNFRLLLAELCERGRAFALLRWLAVLLLGLLHGALRGLHRIDGFRQIAFSQLLRCFTGSLLGRRDGLRVLRVLPEFVQSAGDFLLLFLQRLHQTGRRLLQLLLRLIHLFLGFFDSLLCFRQGVSVLRGRQAEFVAQLVDLVFKFLLGQVKLGERLSLFGLSRTRRGFIELGLRFDHVFPG